ncbi:ATP-binding protein [Nocardia nova]|uniref:NACHT domain-containing protein n=1 Tax=Nocardia nova TaxID=37330 RepID=UPI001C43B261|nr:ATP-binding protein [Nocardia nova]MBV7705430.1 ATP-binding protein [Nocardia nova]
MTGNGSLRTTFTAELRALYAEAGSPEVGEIVTWVETNHRRALKPKAVESWLGLKEPARIPSTNDGLIPLLAYLHRKTRRPFDEVQKQRWSKARRAAFAEKPGRGDVSPDALRPEGLDELVARASAEGRATADAKILPTVDRLAQLTSKLRTSLDELTGCLAIVGEGGLGKSVLLGQLFDAWTANGRAVWFISCGRILTTADLATFDAVDRALGEVAIGARDERNSTRALQETPTLTELVARSAPEAVILDTVDLVVHESNCDHVADLLRHLARSTSVFWTCRELEWNNYLKNERGINQLTYPIPVLTPTEIGVWARAYTEAVGVDAESARAFLDSVVGENVRPGVREILASPLRLSMACEIYAANGPIPDDLSVTELYHQYRERRIAQDRYGRRSSTARAQEAVADILAARMWTQSVDRLVVSVPGASVSDSPALRNLLSDGVVTRIGGRYGFFHQTYAEFSIAHWLVSSGAPDDLRQLAEGLTDYRVPAFWGVAGHALTLEQSDDSYREISATVPLEVVAGVRAHFAAAFARRSPALVIETAQRVRRHSTALLLSCIRVLDSAPEECLDAAVTVVTECMAEAGKSADIGETAVAAVALVGGRLHRRLPAADRDDNLTRVLTTVLAASSGLETPSRSSILARFLDRILDDDVSAEELRVLVGHYTLLPEPARARILIHTAGGPRNPAHDRDLLKAARTQQCPADAVEELTALVLRNWPDLPLREELGWTGWKQFLDMPLPKRWDSCQVRVVAGLCDSLTTAESVLDVFIGPGKPVTDRYTNVAKFIAEHYRDAVLERLLRQGVGSSAAQIGMACTVLNFIADTLSANERRRALSKLEDWLDGDERRVRSAMIKVSGRDLALLGDRLDELQVLTADGALDRHGRSVVRSAVDTFMNTLPGHVLADIADRIYPLIGANEPEERWRRARLDGATAAYSDEAMVRAALEIREGGVRGASEAAKGIVASFESITASDDVIGGEAIGWLFGLLDARHANAVRCIAGLLSSIADNPAFPDDRGRYVTLRLTDALRVDDSHTVRALLDLLVTIDHRWKMTSVAAAEVIAEFRLIVDELRSPDCTSARRDELPSFFNLYKQAFTALGLRHLSSEERRSMIVDLLTTVDVGEIAGRSKRTLAHLMILLSDRDPGLLTVFEDLWPEVSAANKGAIAECFTVKERDSLGIRSRALAARTDCPDDVKNMIYQKFP